MIAYTKFYFLSILFLLFMVKFYKLLLGVIKKDIIRFFITIFDLTILEMEVTYAN